MRILILGAGGIGGYYGGRLAAANADVTFLVRPARAETLRGSGLVIESPVGGERLKVDVATQETLSGAYDLILMSCKAYDLAGAIEAIRPAVGGGTAILPLLNGLAHLDALDAAFGADHVLGGIAHISVALAEDGVIHHLNKLDLLTYGERDATASRQRCDAIETLFATSHFEPRRSDAILQDMWEKFAFITAAAGITSLMRASVRSILASTDGERLTRDMLDECASVAEASGFPLRPEAKEWGAGVLTTPSAFTASMLRDIEAGRPVEADHLQGDMIRRGEARGAVTPLLRIAYCHLQAYADRRASTV